MSRAETPYGDLTPQELGALAMIRDGADITGAAIAGLLRGVAARHPELLEICEPMGATDPRFPRPYFGAILTAAGRDAVAAGVQS